MKYKYHFIGYQEYEPYCERIRRMLNYILKDPDMIFWFAVNEAVCNAAKYGEKGVSQTKIAIEIEINKKGVDVFISSITKAFDINVYKKLKEMADTYPDKTWSEITRHEISGRGFWIMLSGADHVQLNVDKKTTVHLNFKKSTFDDKSTKNNNKISNLIQKFSVKTRRKDLSNARHEKRFNFTHCTN